MREIHRKVNRGPDGKRSESVYESGIPGQGCLVPIAVAVGAGATLWYLSNQDIDLPTFETRDTEGERRAGGGEQQYEGGVEAFDHVEGNQANLAAVVTASDYEADGTVRVRITVPHGDRRLELNQRLRPAELTEGPDGTAFVIRFAVPEAVVLQNGDRVEIPANATVSIGNRTTSLGEAIDQWGQEGSEEVTEAPPVSVEGRVGTGGIPTELAIGQEAVVTLILKDTGSEFRSCVGTVDCSQELAGIPNSDEMGAITYRMQVIPNPLATPDGPQRVIGFEVPQIVTMTVDGQMRSVTVNPEQVLVRVGHGEAMPVLVNGQPNDEIFYRPTRR